MQKGFTLLEIIVSIGIVGALGILIAQTFFSTTRSNTKSELLKDVKQNGDYALTVMAQLIRNARSVSALCGSTPTQLDNFSFANPDEGVTTFTCLLDGSVTRIASTSANRTDYLTDKNLTLGGTTCANSSIQFICTSPADQPTTVKILFTLAQKGTPQNEFEKSSVSFQTSITVRNH